MRMLCLRALAAASASLALPALAGAQASFAAQQRKVEATSHSQLLLWEQGTNPGPPDFDPSTASFAADHADEIAAPDFGGFSEIASSVAPPAVGSVGPEASASASQTSSLDPGSITATGSFSMNADSEFITQADLAELNALLQPPIPYFVGVLQFGSETASSEFSVDFDVSVPTPYHLVGNVAHTQGTIGSVPPPRPATGFAQIELIGPSGSLAEVSLTALGGSEDLDVEGVLAPGSYTLSATGLGVTNARCDPFSITCMDPTMSGSFELSLSLTAAVVPGPSYGLALLLAVALAATGAAVLRRQRCA